MSQKFTLAYFVALFSIIVYYMAFYSHLEIKPEPEPVTLLKKDLFLNQLQINENKLCFLEDKSVRVQNNETSYIQKISIEDVEKTWALFIEEGELGTNILPTDESESVVLADGIWNDFEDSNDYCNGRYKKDEATPI